MQKHIRSLVLLLSMVLAAMLHRWCGEVYFIVPYLVFTMLFLNYTALDVRKMHVKRLEVVLLTVQILLSIALYLGCRLFGASQVIAEGLLVGALTPVAASVVVISCALGANRETVTTYTILANIAVSILAPIFFSFIGKHQDMPIIQSFWMIFLRIAPQIVLPFVCALLLQKFTPKFCSAISRHKGASLYVWAVTLTIVLGKTLDDIVSDPNPQWGTIWTLSGLSMALCSILFAAGKMIGNRYGEKIAGGQLLGQKNTSFGVWMAVEYLSPVTAVFPAAYSVCQNLFNSWQMWQHDHQQPSSSNN